MKTVFGDKTAETIERVELRLRGGVETLGRVDHPWPIRRRASMRRGDGVAIDMQRMAVAESLDETHGKTTAQHAMHRVVMTDSSDSGEDVLQPAHPHSIVKRLGPGHGERRIGRESRLEVGYPIAGVRVFLAPLEPRL